jgi:hypothetical protein
MPSQVRKGRRPFIDVLTQLTHVALAIFANYILQVVATSNHYYHIFAMDQLACIIGDSFIHGSIHTYIYISIVLYICPGASEVHHLWINQLSLLTTTAAAGLWEFQCTRREKKNRKKYMCSIYRVEL